MLKSYKWVGLAKQFLLKKGVTLLVDLNTMRLLVESFLLCLSLYLSLCVSLSLSLSSWMISADSVCHELSENIWVWGSVKLGC